ncbi:hypothetical protein RRG08_062769 [Elysia crispata]|uniref:Uncharacterized protein n=1 Tax=Elysia crispata TaxID=231223 RepID=A0AAE0Z6D7_9GAST|nr:hypothetical protein RRG08_062769 [Elysia crispata]
MQHGHHVKTAGSVTSASTSVTVLGLVHVVETMVPVAQAVKRVGLDLPVNMSVNQASMGLSVVRFAVPIVLVVVTLVIMSLESAVRTNVTQDIPGRNVIKGEEEKCNIACDILHGYHAPELTHSVNPPLPWT